MINLKTAEALGQLDVAADAAALLTNVVMWMSSGTPMALVP